ncbi:MAG: hypothetical protein Rpha_1576 [Candidatus Ruthia sp. Apha_13_S6]|nr:hypothetical protein [Candidatus Ruthia sp. Apha_13_S6]
MLHSHLSKPATQAPQPIQAAELNASSEACFLYQGIIRF